jgi:hypothetical protein
MLITHKKILFYIIKFSKNKISERNNLSKPSKMFQLQFK